MNLLKTALDFFPLKCRWVCALMLATVTTLIAQDPVTSLPDNYKREFENEYVRVTRVLYPPFAKLKPHAHTSLPTAYVYLTDSGPVAFKHIGLEYGAVTRPVTVKRAFRLYRGLEEVHEVANLSELPSEFLRVEFKTDPVDPTTLRGKFLPEPSSPESVRKTQFENAQVRITRLRWRSDNAVASEKAIHPSLLVSLTDGEMGNVRWSPAGQPWSAAAMPAAGEALRVEFKTAPLTTR